MTKLIGTMTMTYGFHSCGHHENAYGVGSISISSRRTNGNALDIGEIWFASPTQEQVDKASAAATKYSVSSPDRSEHEAACAKSDIVRRLSFKQACWLQSIVTKALNEAMPDGVVPHDDDLPNRN